MQNKTALFTLVMMYFFWGSVAASLDILIPIFKAHFELSPITSQLTSSAFFIAYGTGSLVYFIFSITGRDILNAIGYKKGLIYGLMISTVGILGFLVAAKANSFNLFLVSLFIIAFGFSFQQIVVNPFIIALGAPETASQRVSLGGSVFGMAATVAPILLTLSMYHSINTDNTVLELSSINLPAIILAALFIMAMALILMVDLPEIKNEESMQADLGAFHFPQLVLGMLAIFIYVGVEVTIGSNLAAYLKESRGFEVVQASAFVSLYWGSIMIIRWADAIDVFGFSKAVEKVWKIILPFVAFGVITFFNWLRGGDISEFGYYIPYVVVATIALMISGKNAANTLMIMGALAAAMMMLGLMTEGRTAMFCFVSGGLFCSVMWPCIFNIAISGLGKYTNQGSSLLVMMIVGGAFIPLVQGYLAKSYGYQFSYILPIFCFAYIMFYGWYGRRLIVGGGD